MTAVAALVTGLTTSLHCAGMCGPIACGLGSLAQSQGERLATASLYHACRLASYAIIGAICGALGQQPLQGFFHSPAVLLPWALVVVLLVMAFGWDKQKAARPAIFIRFITRFRFKIGQFPIGWSAAAMGLLTPFLPCGPLYLIFGTSLLAGSAAKGAEFTLAFGIGTVPLLWLTHQQFHRLSTKLSPLAIGRLRRGLALATALILAWRLHGTLPSLLHPATPVPEAIPSCCH
jgi:sulfite exporter TauE/SafE